MGIISVDLGTTNIKACSYTDQLKVIGVHSWAVSYMRTGAFVEFDPDQYFQDIQTLLSACRADFSDAEAQMQIVLTGQAESLVVLGQDCVPVRPGISWLDMRSTSECAELQQVFPPEISYPITGQPEIIPTWPLTKMLWIRQHEPAVFDAAAHYLLLKDYIVFRLTGRLCGEYSVYPFSFYFDLHRKEYWKAPLEYCGISLSQLPELVPPCSIVGEILPEIQLSTGLSARTAVNIGTLDHFSGMIGTGNLCVGQISESAGTVSSIATFVENPTMGQFRIPVYCGPFENSYIYLPVCESGGMSLEWFRNEFLSGEDYESINREAARRAATGALTFLPYLTGVNPPEFNPNASGVFFGVRAEHNKYDFALAIMYGVACLLRKNIDHFRQAGIPVDRIISTGGGARSALWTQIKADIAGVPVIVPQNEEAPSLGSAIIAAVSMGAYSSFDEAVKACVCVKKTYYPNQDRTLYEKKYQLFLRTCEAVEPLFLEATEL